MTCEHAKPAKRAHALSDRATIRPLSGQRPQEPRGLKAVPARRRAPAPLQPAKLSLRSLSVGQGELAAGPPTPAASLTAGLAGGRASQRSSPSAARNTRLKPTGP